MNRVRIKLTKIPEKLSKKGGYRARVLDNGVVDFDEFVQEVVDKSGFRMEPRMLKMYLEATMETMISGVLSDGRTRRIGDYFFAWSQGRRTLRGAGVYYRADGRRSFIFRIVRLGI